MTQTTALAHHELLQTLLKRGFDELNHGHIREASECCRRALKIKPDLVQAHFLVGLVALEARDRKTALQAFGSVTKLQKDHIAAWAQLAKLFISDGQVNLADKALGQALGLESTDPIVHDLLGSVFSLMGEHGRAQSHFQKSNTLQPDHPPFMLNYANNLVYHGETAQAEKIMRSIIKIQSNSPQAHWTLANSRKAVDLSHIDEMKTLTERAGVHPRALAFYWYGIGKEFEDLQEWGQAFAAYSRGAGERRKTVEYDEKAEIASFRFLEESYTKEWFDHQGQGNPDVSPIFVLGQPRTGTTLVERIITSHSQVHSGGELQQFSLAIRRLGNFQDPKRFSVGFFETAMALDPYKLGSLYINTTKKMAGDTPYFVDKLPQNYMMVPLILKALPKAKIIHLSRNPMDACFASYKQLFADAYLHSYDQLEMARHHARYRRLMGIWRERFPNQFLDISYEETAGNFEPSARALISFLGLGWEEACLNFHQQDRAVTTASAVQVREPAHTRSIGRWLKYEPQLIPMRDALRDQGIDPHEGPTPRPAQ